MTKLFFTSLLALIFCLCIAKGNPPDTNKLLVIVNYGSNLKITKNQILDLKLPLFMDNVGASFFITFKPGIVIGISYSQDDYNLKKGMYSVMYSCNKSSIIYGVEKNKKGKYYRNDFGLGISNYHLQILNKTNTKPLDSLYNKYEYLSNYVSSNNNIFVSYGLTYGFLDYFNKRLKLTISQRSYFFLSKDQIFYNTISNRFSFDLSLGVQLFIR